MRRISGLLLATALLAGCAPAASRSGAASPGPDGLPSGWIVFTSPDGSFSLDLPGKPEAVTRFVTLGSDTVPLSTWQSESADGKVLYGVAYADYPVAFIAGTDHQAMLDGAVNGFVTTSKGTLIQSHHIQLRNYPGRDFTATAQGLAIHEHIYLHVSRLFQITAYSHNADIPNADAFLASFAFLP